MERYYDVCIIMAGGQGTRLWPYSNSRKPKQFLPLKGKTFFKMALERAFSVTNDDSCIIIVASAKYSELIEQECGKIDDTKRQRIVFIQEPLAKNTAAAIAMAAVFCKKTRDKKNTKKLTTLVLTSDHIIEPQDVFTAQALSLLEYISVQSLALIGIKPNRPETGFGYMEIDTGEQPVKKIASFHEKPDKETAVKYLESNKYFWNSGMFAFPIDFILDQFKKHSLQVLSPFEKLAAPPDSAYQTKNNLKIVHNWPGLDAAYNETPNISFDYAVVEKCSDVVMVIADFDWRDVGSWDEYAAISEGDSENVYTKDAKNNFVLSDIPVAICDCDDLVVYIQSGKDKETPIALIAKKGETQNIRVLAEKIKAAGRDDLL